MIVLLVINNFKKLFLSYGFLATSPNDFNRDTGVMLKNITSEKGKRLGGNYQVNFFSTKIRDTL